MIDLGSVAQIVVRDRRGWDLNMSLVRLPSGGVLVHSPTLGGDEVFAQVEAVGAPRVLFAPNHYHHLGLPKYRARYPEARAICSDGARPRLIKKGHQDLGGLDGVELPEGARFLELPGVKTGETWLSVPGEGGPTFIVCDGFFNMRETPRGIVGFLLKRLDVAPGLKLGRSFKWMIRDKRAYRAWLLETLRTERPRRIVFSHGEPILDDATERLIAVTESALPT